MQHAQTVDRATAYSGISRGKFAVWLFLASEVMFFTGLIGSYIVIRAGAPSWPDPASELAINITAFNTFVLICSSVTMVRALYKLQAGEQTAFRQSLLATLALGVFFLGVQMYEYNSLLSHGLTPQRDLFGSTFYTLTGFHGAHVLGGVLVLAYLSVKALRGAYDEDNYESVEFAGLYWHFVDLVWILLFTIVYLI